MAVRNVPLSVEVWGEIAGILTPPEQQLFKTQLLRDQWHSHAVVALLKAADHHNRDLLAGALLHDVGKTKVRITQWDRTVAVVVQKFMPAFSHTLAHKPITPFTRAFAVREHHAEWGAVLAENAGSSPETIRLIRHHQDKTVPPTDHNLKALQWADDQC
jgi:putative nucleotidyltransferase with HDIG domain